MKLEYRTNIEVTSDKLVGIIESPTTIRVNTFTEESADKFHQSFIKASTSKQPIIPIIIDSYGGECDALLYMVDILKSSSKPVSTICVGKAMSCGAILLTCGWEGYRFCSENSSIMIHDVAWGSRGKVGELESVSKEARRLNDKVYKIMADNCGKHKKYFWDIVQSRGRSDWYLSAKEALAHNIINSVKIPNIKMNMSVEYIFD